MEMHKKPFYVLYAPDETNYESEALAVLERYQADAVAILKTSGSVLIDLVNSTASVFSENSNPPLVRSSQVMAFLYSNRGVLAQAEDRLAEFYKLCKICTEKFAKATHRVMPESEAVSSTQALQTKYNHYYKSVKGLDVIDTYAVNELFEVTNPCLAHIVKKALCAGKRGSKDFLKDLEEIRDTAERAINLQHQLNQNKK